jgi:UPF0271 protein
MPTPAPARSIDLNADLGEGFPDDAALLERVTSASIACGGHAGDAGTMAATLSLARARNVAVGAHPGYPDRAGMGRRAMNLPAEEVERLILDQFEALARVAATLGVPVAYVKPHGALYNQAQHEEPIARGVVAALMRLALPLLGQPGTLLEARASDAGVMYLREGFPDRRYLPDGRLVPRTQPDAILHDPAEITDQVLRLIAEGMSTLCIHGDDPRAVANADLVRRILRDHDVALRSFTVPDQP